MVACKGPGKSTVLSWLAWNFLATRPFPKIAATSITADNLRDNLWAEMSKWQTRSPFLRGAFHVDTKRIYAIGHEETWFMSARAWSHDADEETQGSTLAGLWADHVLFIVDEAGLIPDAVAKTAEAALIGRGEKRIVIAGNPIQMSGPLYRAAVEQRSIWEVVEVTGDPADPKRAPRVDPVRAQELIDAYGRDSAYIQYTVLGKFPRGSTDALVSMDQFEAAFARWDSPAELAVTPRTLGVDVARHGDNKTVIARRAGDCVHEIRDADWWIGQDTEYTSHRVTEIADEWAGGEAAGTKGAGKRVPVYVDDTGVGGGVTDKLLALGYNAVGVIVEARAEGYTASGDKASDVHADLKSFICADIQERFRSGKIALDPRLKQTTLVAEGVTLKVGYSTGRRRIEGKKDYKRRTGRSTDFWDAVMLSYGDAAVGSGPFVIL